MAVEDAGMAADDEVARAVLVQQSADAQKLVAHFHAATRVAGSAAPFSTPRIPPGARLEDKAAWPRERADLFRLTHQCERTTVAGHGIGGAAAVAHDFGSKLNA